MNNKYENLIYNAAQMCQREREYVGDEFKEYLIELTVKECISQMSDHLDKQRVLRYFGMEVLNG